MLYNREKEVGHIVFKCRLRKKYILKPSANRSPYIFPLVQKVKHRV